MKQKIMKGMEIYHASPENFKTSLTSLESDRVGQLLQILYFETPVCHSFPISTVCFSPWASKTQPFRGLALRYHYILGRVFAPCSARVEGSGSKSFEVEPKSRRRRVLIKE